MPSSLALQARRKMCGRKSTALEEIRCFHHHRRRRRLPLSLSIDCPLFKTSIHLLSVMFDGEEVAQYLSST
jgi:hypothetical protein